MIKKKTNQHDDEDFAAYDPAEAIAITPVSYTHLTLPTNREV